MHAQLLPFEGDVLPPAADDFPAEAARYVAYMREELQDPAFALEDVGARSHEVADLGDHRLFLGEHRGEQMPWPNLGVPQATRHPLGVGDGLAPQSASLVANERLGYRDAWVRLGFDDASPCVFTRGLGGRTLELPSRHGEGKLVFADEALREAIEAAHLIPVRYVDETGAATERWPANPNGSVGGAAGLCDPSGRIFGLMPHPEAYLDPENHPRWRAQAAAGELPPVGLGLHILAGGIRAVLAGL